MRNTQIRDSSDQRESSGLPRPPLSSRHTPPKPIYKSNSQKQIKNSDAESGKGHHSKHFDHAAYDEVFEDPLTEVYRPTSQLLIDDYTPYCDTGDNIKIEEIEVEPPRRPPSVKEFHSNTTKAETASPYTAKDHGKVHEAADFMSTETNQYFSSKFAEVYPEAGLVTESQRQGATETSREEGAIVKRLKELMQYHKTETLSKDPKKTNEKEGQQKKWSSLQAKDEASNHNVFTKPELVDQSSHHSEKKHASSKDLAEEGGRQREIFSEEIMVALYDFVGERNKDVNFKKGDYIRLIDRRADGWYLAEVDGRIGFVPSNYLISKKEFQGIN